MANFLFNTASLLSIASAGLLSVSANASLRHLTPQMLTGQSQEAGEIAQVLGEFTVAQEISRGKGPGNLCPKALDDRSLSCGDKVWVFQTAGSVLMINAPTAESLATNQLSVWTVEGKQCRGSASISEAMEQGIGNLNLCGFVKAQNAPSEYTVESAADSNSGPVVGESAKPATGGEAIINSVLGVSGVILGSHDTKMSMPNESANVIQVEDTYRSQGIQNTMLLMR